MPHCVISLFLHVFRGNSTADDKQSIVQWALDYAKAFIEEKLKRPSAEDLLVEEDIKLLPKVILFHSQRVSSYPILQSGGGRSKVMQDDLVHNHAPAAMQVFDRHHAIRAVLYLSEQSHCAAAAACVTHCGHENGRSCYARCLEPDSFHYPRTEAQCCVCRYSLGWRTSSWPSMWACMLRAW